ncbi:cytochrome P450/NADPH-cytochrome P450 reductase [Rhizobium sp. ERR 922]|nr:MULTISPECIES: cytochrome P450 [unclassified Rhizobium]TWB46419.1 cytochrome P450/NADPH-cytochrome P450 reductase [Rhizobium sp. ERR 922]TWB88786.1 cytochrome P450/NADPH-cytochrome P450 reductase [Rhizobium sp. ERR 942]
MNKLHSIPEPRGVPILGHVSSIDPNAPVQSLMRLARDLGPIYRLETFGRKITVVSNQALTAELCDERRFRKALHPPLRELREVAEDGLFTAYNEEPNWGKAHRLLMPAFGPLGLRNMFDRMLDVAEQMMVRWERFGASAEIDIADNMTRLTLDTIALCAFDYRFNSFYQNEMHPFVAAMTGALDEAGNRSRLPRSASKLMLLRNRRFDADAKILSDVADALIEERLRDPRLGDREDLLDVMLTARDNETGETLSRKNIGYQMIPFLVAGHETTSGLLSFATYLLLKNPDVLTRLRTHVDHVLGGDVPTAQHLEGLKFVEQVLMETLRLWPTAPAFAVHPLEDTTIGGRYAVKADDILLILSPILHRDPDVWDDPEVFRPERFAPEHAAKLPPHSWKPFGNGQRACIGRGFAMQEATLVLAMMLQRFDIDLIDRSYRLVVSESLTLKPKGLFIRARRRDLPAGTPKSRMPTPSTRPLVRPRQTASEDRGPLLVLYGSNTGTCEAFAQKLAGAAQAMGYQAIIATANEYASGIPDDLPLVVITASYEGQPPDNADQFVAWAEALEPEALKGRPFAVFGCGNRQWARTWQAVPKRVEAALLRAGARAVLPRGEADAGGDLFGAYDTWLSGFWSSLATALGQEAPDRPAIARGFDVEVRTGERERLLRLEELRQGVVMSNTELVNVKGGGRSKRFVEIKLPRGMSYQTGDYLAVLARNPADVVARALRRYGLKDDTELVLHPSAEAPSALPVDKPITAGELFAGYVELQQLATLQQVRALVETISCPPERRDAERLIDPGVYKAELLAKRASLLELVERFASADYSLGMFLAALPPMKARLYSIASSPLVSSETCALTFSVLDLPSLHGNSRFKGVASTFLAAAQPGDPVAVAVRPSQRGFRPPEDNAVPIVMVCAGSGIAPFRGFLQERAARKAAGAETGPALLFFGIRDPDIDYLHRHELEAWEKEGIVSVRLACSTSTKTQYVQNRIWEDRKDVEDLFRRGAHVYVCGDGEKMAPAVRETFLKIYRSATGASLEEAQCWAEQIEREAIRYVADVFS